MVGQRGVTVVVRRNIRADARAEFEAWLEGIIEAASAFEGHLGAEVIRPAPGAGEDYVAIFRFDSEEHLAAWDASEERTQWLARAEAFTVGQRTEERVSGLEFWFTLPKDAGRRPPPPWKMAIATTLGIYPLALFIPPRMAAAFEGWPRALVTLAGALIMVTLMTWVVMPAVIRVLRPWLFADRT